MTTRTAVSPETEAERAFYRVCKPGDINPFAPKDTCCIRIDGGGPYYCTREHGHADLCVSSTDTTVVSVASARAKSLSTAGSGV